MNARLVCFYCLKPAEFVIVKNNPFREIDLCQTCAFFVHKRDNASIFRRQPRAESTETDGTR